MSARRAVFATFLVALTARLVVVAWAGARFPPVADAVFYNAIAERIAAGQGATWLWPDGAVTPVAHYPVGYSLLLAAAYSVAATPWAAMLVNVAFGAAACAACAALVASATTPKRGLGAGLAVALHPALVLYTPALMTEGVTAALGPVMVAVAGGRGWGARFAAGGLLGLAVLVRPQSVLLLPAVLVAGVVGAAAGRQGAGGRLRRFVCTGAVVGLAVAVVVGPWVARNCVRMGSCSVSFNGGWNLLIGAQTADGAWAPVEVPEACRTVWDEAAKDACFGAVARQAWRREPLRLLATAPAKLAVTFDYFGAAPWYLHASNPAAFSLRAKHVAAGVETLTSRVSLALALGALVPPLRFATRGRRRLAVAAVAGAALLPHAWPAYVLLGALAAWAAVGARSATRVLMASAATVLVATTVVHAVFFGAGRYGLPVVPFVVMVAALAGRRQTWEELPVDAGQGIAGTARASARAAREESPSSEECDAG